MRGLSKGSLIAAGMLVAACSVEEVGDVEERDATEAPPSVTEELPEGYRFTCEQLDLDASSSLDFGDYLLFSAAFGDQGDTPNGLPMDFATYLEFSGRYGEACSLGLKAPLAFATDAEIDAGAIPTVFDALEAQGEELSEGDLAIAYDEQGLFGRVEQLPVIHPGDIIEVGETTIEDVERYAAQYNEGGVAYHLRHFEALVEFGMYLPGDDVHEELREAYLAAAHGQPVPEPAEEAPTCNASCGVTLWKQPRHVSAVGARTCNDGYRTIGHEIRTRCDADDEEDFDEEGSSAYARMSCDLDAMAGLHCVYGPGCRRPQHCEADLGTYAGENIDLGTINDEQAEIDIDDSAQAYAAGKAFAYVLPVGAAAGLAGKPIEGRSEARDISCDVPHQVAAWTWTFLDRIYRPLMADGADRLGLPSWTFDAILGATIQQIEPPPDTDKCTGTTLGQHGSHFGASRSTNMPRPCGANGGCEPGYVCRMAGNATYEQCIENPATVAPERKYQAIWPTRRSVPMVKMHAQAMGRTFVALPPPDDASWDIGAQARAHVAARANFWVKDIQSAGMGTSCAHWLPGDEKYDRLYDRPVYHRGVWVACQTALEPGVELGDANFGEACGIDPNRPPVGCDDDWEDPDD